MSSQLNILIVDDHQILIDGVVELLSKNEEFNIVATASNPSRALEVIRNHSVDLLISDVNMPEMKGDELIPLLKKEKPGLKVIALSMHEEKHIIKDVLKAGADGYVLKKSTHNELEEAIKKVMNDETFVSAAITKMLVDDFKNPSVIDALSEREREIIKLIVKEFTNKQIAEALFISEKTVETHKRNIFRKTDSNSAVGLTKFAIEHHLV